uniref:Histone deacetylase 14 n=1 Tax=Tanacetum cinerariifolium TaxID=118510 RepID=A0A699IAD8_TANCI|nr:histone deacetylase 14 [Tanacetum cinerariifolium]
MADVNAPSGQAPVMAPPVRTDDQILARIRCQLDEQWFVLTKDTLREALQITLVNNNQAFITPPSSDALINFFNELGYPKLVRNVSNVVTNDMFQPWRALITIINLCLTGKTSGFERPMAPDKRNMSRHTTGKKKATLIVIPSIRFTKLIIHHLQRRHKFHPRPDSSLHLTNEEPVLGYLKFSAKGIKREVFRMPIPGSLITTNIQEASYYQEYLENVAKHRRYLAGETGSDQESPAPKPTKPDRKPKSTAPKVPPRPSVSIPVTSAQPAPTSAPAKPQEKKHKQATEISDKPPKSKKSKYGFISKKRSLKSVAVSVAEDVPAMEPQESAPTSGHREPELGKYQPLPEVPGKGKAKVTEEQVAHDLLSLQKPKKKILVDQYILQRSTFTTIGSSGQDEPSYAELEQSERLDPGAQAESQTGSDADTQDEGQARSNPDEISKGQAGPDPGNAGAEVQSIPSPMVHAGSDREHIDLDVADVSPQPSTEQLDEGFTATAYPKVSKAASEVVTDMVDWAMQEPLQNYFRDLPEADMKDILHQRMWESESYESHKDHMQLFEAFEKLMNRDHSEELAQDLAEARKKKKETIRSSGAPGDSGSSQVPPPLPPPSSTNQEKERPVTPKPAWSIPSSDVPVPTNNWASALASNYSPPPEDSLLVQTKCHKLLTDSVDDPILRHNVSTPLPLGGPPGQVTIQSDFFFNKDLEYLRYGSKGSRPALSISKMKAAYYPDAGLEQMVLDQFWIDDECKYNIVAMYGISHWWFQRQRFYIDRHKSEGDRSAVRTHMRILSVVRIEVFSMYGYDYMKKIVLCRGS